MCGISGIASLKPVSQQDIQVMNQALAHRGPDAEGYYLKNNIALGHRRLSIIDIEVRSNQPFFSQSNRYVIVYNGEIYNYKDVAKELVQRGLTLRTTSDTEVIIEAFAIWGTGVIHKLNGMFAFAIYDTEENKFFFFRDRVGKKPLYYYLKDGLFLFASELKSILQHPAARPDYNLSTIGTFLQMGFIPEPQTFYNHVSKFPAGHYGVLSSDLKLSILPYWNATHYITTKMFITENVALDKLKVLLDDAVHSRLIADVPVGIFLSGGIDSSLVAASASKVTRLKTFSIGFREDKFDESNYANQVASHLNTDHYSYELKESEAAEMIDSYLDHFDEPFADTSAVPMMLVSKLAKKEVTVALTGDGGDELFLGYGAYEWAERLANPFWRFGKPILKRIFDVAPSSRLKRISHHFDEVSSANKRKHIFSQEQYFFSQRETSEILLEPSKLLSDFIYYDLDHLSILSEGERQAIFDFQMYLRDDLLVKVDRASMRFGLECRSPLLDYRLVEFAMNLPESLKKKGATTKYLMKKVLFEMVPAEIFNRPKRGFSIPLGQWMKGDLSHLMDYLNEDNLNKTRVFNALYVKGLIHRFNQGEDYLYNRLWVVMIIQRFLLQQS